MNIKTVVANILRSEGVEFVCCFPENPLIGAFATVGCVESYVARNGWS
jgi:hypothetical protein